jgi:hypothetical protein
MKKNTVLLGKSGKSHSPDSEHYVIKQFGKFVPFFGLLMFVIFRILHALMR